MKSIYSPSSLLIILFGCLVLIQFYSVHGKDVRAAVVTPSATCFLPSNRQVSIGSKESVNQYVRLRRLHNSMTQTQMDDDGGIDSSILLDEEGAERSRRIFLKSSFVDIPSSLMFVRSPSAYALQPEEASKDYDSYAKNYDALDGGQASTLLGIDEARSSLFRQARGNVLEIGAGTGLNLDKYDPSLLESITLVDISEVSIWTNTIFVCFEIHIVRV